MAKTQEQTEKPFSEIDTLAKIGRELDRIEGASHPDPACMTRTLNWILSRYAPAGYTFTQHEIAQ